MADNKIVERLTPLDLLMPRTYIGIILIFRTTEPTLSVSGRLRRGVDGLVKQVPWLSGRVFSSISPEGRASALEIRWSANEAPPKIVDKGSIAASYETSAANGMLPADIPGDIWPVPSMVDDALPATGAPVFAAGLFRFADNKGMGLSVCLHHNAVDGTGFGEVVRLWAQNIAGSGLPCPDLCRDRLSRLSDALSSDLSAVSSQSPDSLSASLPEYSTKPPAPPAEVPPCRFRLFAIPVEQVNVAKQRLSSRMSTAPTLTTNTMVCALVWSAIARVRMQRNPVLANETSRLVMPVNGRQRISAEFSTPENPYLGNAVFFSRAQLSIKDLGAYTGPDDLPALADICDVVARSQSSTQINARYIAEVYSLVDRMDDYKTIHVDMDMFSERDVTMISWANLDLYNLEFGTELGKPEFVRTPHGVADGFGLILPRKRGPDEVIEVIISLRRDDMDALEQDSTWKSVVTRGRYEQGYKSLAS